MAETASGSVRASILPDGVFEAPIIVERSLFTNEQRGVLRGIALGMTAAISILALASALNPLRIRQEITDIERIFLAVKSVIFPGLFVVISTGRMAKHRFFSPEDIDGGGLSNGTPQAKVLQSLLQNTLEQFAIAFISYLAWSVIMPATWLSAVPVASLFFGVGRVLFFVTYHNGAKSRALGFTLSFYPSALMLIGACIYGVFEMTDRHI